MAELPLALGNVPKTAENHTEVPTKINWSKCDIQTLQQLVNEQIRREDLFHLCDNETKLEKLVVILNDCAKEAAGSKPKPVKKYKPWSHEIRNLCKISKQYHWEWTNSGAPKSKDNPLWLRCITAKRNLQRAQRQEDAKRRYGLYTEIMDTNTSDEKLFHKLINIQRNGKTSKLSQLTVDGKILVKPGDIAEGWATYFERLSKSL